MKEWYYAQDQQQRGPVSKSELLDLLKSGDVDQKDLVWTSGMGDWQPAHSVSGLLTSGESNTPTSSPATGSPKAYSENRDVAGAVHQERDRPATDSAVKYAGFWKQLFAFLIDIIIVIFASAFISILLVSGGSQEEVESVMNEIGLVIGWLYFANMESSNKQATLGKMALGIKVTDKKGNRVGFAKTTGRHFGKIISVMILLIGYIMAAFTDKKQALHDKMAGCLVINA